MVEISSELLATGIVGSLLAIALFLLYVNIRIRCDRLEGDIEVLKMKLADREKK